MFFRSLVSSKACGLAPVAKRIHARALSTNIETIALHGGHCADPTTTARGVPVYRTAPYQFKNTEHARALFALEELGNIYTRLGNPTSEVLEKRFSLMQGAPELGSLALSSGTAACHYAIVNLASKGDNIVSANNLYGGTYTMFDAILPQFGIECRFVDINDPNAIAAAVDDKTRCVFAETVSNPALQVTDLDAVSDVAKAHGLPLVVDDTFTTPYLCKPIDHGADIIAHSLTKWSGGHGVGVGGILCDSGRFKWKAGNHPLYDEPDESYSGLRWGHDLPATLAPLAFILRARTVPLRNLGSCISPDNSWMMLQGIETLPLRMERHCENALKVAEHLQAHPAVEWVRYPGLKSSEEYERNLKYLGGKGGSMVVFGVKADDGRMAGSKFIDSLRLISHVANVGDAKTLAIHPSTTTHSQLTDEQQKAGGISPELVRLSVGIENIEDILEDIDQALKKAAC